MKKILLLAAISAALLCGCRTALNSGHVVSVTTSGIGLHVVTSSTTADAAPEFSFGFFRPTVLLEPVSTNAMLVPNVADTFSYDQTSTFGLGIGENFASGTYQALTPNGTNTLAAQ